METSEGLTPYYRIKDAPKFGALLRTKRAEAGLTSAEVTRTFGILSSMLSVMERAQQTVFRADAIEKLRAFIDAMGVPKEALEVTQLTQAQWRRHCRSNKNGSPRRRTPQIAVPTQGLLMAPEAPLVVVDVVKDAAASGLVGKAEFLVKLHQEGLLSEAAFRVALKDLASK